MIIIISRAELKVKFYWKPSLLDHDKLQERRRHCPTCGMAEGGDFFASHGRGRGLRYGKPTDREPLRRPHCAVNERATTKGSDSNLVQQCNAASSVESLSTSLMNDCRVTDAHKTYALSPTAKEFVPRSNCLTIATHQPVYHQTEEVEDNEVEAGMSDDFLIDQLKVILDDLARSPGNFDALATALLNLLTSCASGLTTITAVVNTIFDRSVMEANLRYNGARLCNYLSQNVLTETEDKTFRQLLLQKCQAEFSKIPDYMKKTEQSTWIHGLAHFLGELFIHLEVGTEGHTARATVLGHHLCNFLSLLLDHRTEGNLKCVGQVLKFAGGAMEDEQRKIKNTSALDVLMQKINEITCNDTQVSKYIREMFVKIVELRASNWGRAVISPVTREEPFVGDVPCGDVVLYGPDGQPLTLEESAFLESASYLYYNTEDESGDYADYSQGEGWSTEDDQMDEEMTAAYEEFLAQQGSCYPPQL